MRRHHALLTLVAALLAACGPAQPVPAPGLPAQPADGPRAIEALAIAPGAAPVVAGRVAQVRFAEPRAARRYATLAASDPKHRWEAADVVKYVVTLAKRTGGSDFSTVVAGPIDVAKAGGGEARFTNLSQGEYYRAFVQAVGRIGGEGGTGGMSVLNQAATTDHADFDFTATQDVNAMITASVAVNLDDTAFAGTGTLTLGAPVDGSYTNPVANPTITLVGGLPNANPVKDATTYTAGTPIQRVVRDQQNRFWVAGGNATHAVSIMSTTGVVQASTVLPVSGVGNSPNGLAVAPNGHVWVAADGGYPSYANGRVFELDANGAKVRTVATGGASPTALALDGAGNVWVAHRQNGPVVKLSPTGDVLGTFTAAADGEGPYSIVVDKDQNVWVGGNNSGKVTKFSNAGTVLGTYDVGQTVFAMLVDESNNVWVSAYNAHRVKVLKSDGTVLHTIKPGTTDTPGPVGLALDSENQVWVANNAESTVSILWPDGTVKATLPAPYGPWDPLVDKANRTAWVLSPNTSQFFRYTY